ncbi:MAG: RagB/SusD family nutrient uptake outer membrane protein [Prevotellaceae bacterium]|jgi:hypothetical protein|nr:RagB/SusD family nutrient uptake outer membrane protein [Prevotellaceae bacterium]
MKKNYYFRIFGGANLLSGSFRLPVIILSCALAFGSCNYLDIVPDNVPTIDHAFRNRAEAERYLYGLFSYLPVFGNEGSNPALMGGDEVWAAESLISMNYTCSYIARGAQGTNDPIANYFSSWQEMSADDIGKRNMSKLRGGQPLFTAISDCNIFLENIDKPYDLKADERTRWIGEVKFLKAFYHFWLFRMYGPIPLIKENLSISSESGEVQRYREPVDDVVEYIVSLLDEAVELLPPFIEDITRESGRPNQIIALALKAQTLAYAASPLFNGSSTEPPSFSLIDNRNVQLFPQTYNPEKWKKAADALKAAIDIAHQNGHKLYDFHTNAYAALLNEKTILAMQVRGAVTERWNKEIIWGDSNNNMSHMQIICYPWLEQANVQGAVYKSYAPTMQVVEQFHTSNGVPIDEDKTWSGVDLMGMRTATADDRQYIKQGSQTINLHFDREARFYSSIIFDNGTFFGSNRFGDNTTNANYMWATTFIPNFQILTRDRYSVTGYNCKKLISYMSSLSGGSYSNYAYAFPIIRLADLYLMYAESLNEYQGPGAEVYSYIDTVRKRSGLNGVVESWRDYAIESTKPLNKDGLRDIIYRERLIELAFEGSRFWDLRRWKLAEQYMNRPVRGLTASASYADYYNPRELYQLKFEKKDYFWPIKLNTLLRNMNLVQNPGWQ